MSWPRAVLLACGLTAGVAGAVRADGGTVRASAVRGGLRVTVFTSPTPPRAGPVDVSVLVQDAATGDPRPGPAVTVRAVSRERSWRTVRETATRDSATNKLFVAATVELAEPGWWDVTVDVEGAEVGFALEVAPPLPGWLTFAGWVGWPAAAVAVYAVHRRLVRRRRPV